MAILCETTAFGGWENCLRLSNGTIELVVTLDLGPRVIRFGFVDGQNLFHTFASTLGTNAGAQWESYGGHRLWHAPEVMPRTYYPDNNPVAHEWDGTTLVLTPPEETTNKLQLSIAITMDPDKPLVSLQHRIQNTHVWDTELAPWCLSVMATGGRAIFPQEKYVSHDDSLVPGRPLVLWNFTHMADPRWTWGNKYIQLQQDDSIPTKQKAGAMNTRAWAAYDLNGDVFIKHFGYTPDATYPDFGCNCEFFTMPEFLEVESLGPLTRLAPGETAEHTEQWGLFQAELGADEASLDANLLPLVEQVPPA